MEKGQGKAGTKDCLWVEEEKEAHRQMAVSKGTRGNLRVRCAGLLIAGLQYLETWWSALMTNSRDVI